MTDFSALDGLIADLKQVPAEAAPFVRKALQVTAHNVRDEWRSGARRTGLGGYAASVGYSTEERPGVVRAEVGPTPGRRQSSFGFVEEARGGVRSAPQNAGRDALRANEPDFVEGLEKALADGMRGAGL